MAKSKKKTNKTRLGYIDLYKIKSLFDCKFRYILPNPISMKNEMGFFYNDLTTFKKLPNLIVAIKNYFSVKISVKTFPSVPFGNSNFSLKANVGAI